MAVSRLEPAQEQIAKNSALIIAYLQKIANKFNHIGQAFESGSRLFFNLAIENKSTEDKPESTESKSELTEKDLEKLTISECIEAINNALKASDTLHSYFWQKISIISDEIDDLNIKFIKEHFVKFFFKPLTDSDAWIKFWSKQAALIRESDAVDETPEVSTSATAASPRRPRIAITPDQSGKYEEIVLDKLAGAFTFKILGITAEKDKEKQQKLIPQLTTFTQIINQINDPTKVKNAEAEKAKVSFDGQIKTFQMKTEGKLQLNELTTQTREVINQIRLENPHFKRAEHSDKVLYECLLALIKDLFKDKEKALKEKETTQKEKEDLQGKKEDAQKKIAGAILLDINERYTGFIKKEDVKPPVFLFAMLAELLPYCSNDKKEECKKLVDWHTKSASKQGHFVAGSLSPRSGSPAPSPVLSRALNHSPSKRSLTAATAASGDNNVTRTRPGRSLSFSYATSSSITTFSSPGNSPTTPTPRRKVSTPEPTPTPATPKGGAPK